MPPMVERYTSQQATRRNGAAKLAEKQGGGRVASAKCHVQW